MFYSFGRNDLLHLRLISSGKELTHPIDIEKVILTPEQDAHDLQPPNKTVIENEAETPSSSQEVTCSINAGRTKGWVTLSTFRCL